MGGQAKMNKDTWRLLITSPARGSWNMAVDEAILEETGRGSSLPTLRLFAWEPPCLSLGYAQPIEDVDLDRLHERGWDLVRRPTGGRAVLHTDELTYSVIAPLNEPRVAGTLLESYQRLAKALVEALHLLVLPVQVQEQAVVPAAQTTNPVCFEVPSAFEITVDGKKLIGSAQARRKEGVLQHGSLPLVRRHHSHPPGTGLSRRSRPFSRGGTFARTGHHSRNRPGPRGYLGGNCPCILPGFPICLRTGPSGWGPDSRRKKSR